MKYHGAYEVDPAFVASGAIKWDWTGNGELIVATKGGKKYVVKRNSHVRHPAKGEPKAVYDKNKAEATALEKKQKTLKALMAGIDVETDRVVIEEEHFWDSERMFTTVTTYVADALPETFDYTVLSLGEFLSLAARTAEAIAVLHDHGVIHGDLKPKNVVVKKDGGEYVPYIIDFDSSYPVDAIPARESIGGSDGYRSPETTLYGEGEDEDVSADDITPATDVFSLGVLFHKWWAGAFPGVDAGSVAEAVAEGKPVMIDKRFNAVIGDECGETIRSLLAWTFAANPADRPTAKQVAEVLSDESEVPEAYRNAKDKRGFDTELWDAHKLIAELLPVAELKKLGIRSLKRINEGSGSMSLKYRVAAKGGAEKTLTIAELCEIGYATGKGADVEDAWAEHMIEFEPVDEIARKGYAKIRKAQLAFRKRYLVTTVSGREIDKGCEWLIAEGLAHPKLTEVDADTPWPEHGKAYNSENMARLGIKSISRMEVAGEHRYKITYSEIVDGKNRVNERVPVNNVKLMGFIK